VKRRRDAAHSPRALRLAPSAPIVVSTLTTVITSIPILEPEECVHVRAQVNELRADWIQRGTPEYPFYTIGAASYIDAAPSPGETPRYVERAARYNPLLREHFDWLHTRLLFALSTHLKAVVRTVDDLALPGFHVWEGENIPRGRDLSIHFDLQYLSIPWADMARSDRTQPISYTLPIRLPREGGGLNSWDLTYEDHMRAVRQRGSTIDQVVKEKSPTFHAYTPGVLALHSGHMLHQIAAVEEIRQDDERITLQGHGLLCDGVWTLYW
jgi:hypothetical protein